MNEDGSKEDAPLQESLEEQYVKVNFQMAQTNPLFVCFLKLIYEESCREADLTDCMASHQTTIPHLASNWRIELKTLSSQQAY